MSTTVTATRAGGRDPDWRWFRKQFPTDLDALARSTQAACFWRQMPDAEVLLRMLLLWALTNFGLRSVAARGARSGWATITADSLRDRFRQCEGFLIAVLTHVLAQWVRVPRAEGLPLRLVDASMLAIAGPTGRSFRVHAVFDPRRGALSGVQVTDDSQGEDLTRGDYVAGELVVADRSLARVPSLIALTLRKVFWIVRIHLRTIKLWDADGTRVDLRALALCDEVDARGEPIDRDVFLIHGSERVAARLVLMAVPPERLATARANLYKRASKKCTNVDAVSLRLAGYVALLTTLERTHASASAVLSWYRVRWQIELFFKRCKSLLGLATLVTARPDLQRTRLLSSLLVAALVDRLNEPALALPSSAPPSLWRWTHIHHLDLLRAVSGEQDLQSRRAKVSVAASAADGSGGVTVHFA